ncbi:hypothetical protein SELMODRAFT_233394 [Selaginella moellendorffii]|uniref:X8 domain-containing protein n=1 Tax=Selaginella moellendorffii TaxID=88036 RepID=D8S8J2_SELML|nr:hypothetical protein SELMODRAFT_233394 [Selaginella moellendorffii]
MLVRLDFSTTLSLLLLLLLVGSSRAQVGVNWGTQVSHPLHAPSVVKMLQKNSFTRVKMFDTDASVLHALAGSNIEVMVGIPNTMLETLSSSMHAARNWVESNVTWYLKYPKRRVDIRYVAVGEEPLHDVRLDAVIGAVKNIRAALDKQTRTRDIKTTIPFSAGIVTSNSFTPSTGNFIRPDEMKTILELLSDSKSPFTVNIHPFISSVNDPSFPLDFAFFDGDFPFQQDQGNNYTNAFDAIFDTVVSALKQAGFPDMPIIVGGTGWPTDCNLQANPQNAKRFNQGLVKRIESSRGTPLRPGKLHAYIFSLVDEDRKKPGYERHWGIFQYDGTRKYDLTLLGARELENVPDVEYMPARWCVSNDATDGLEQRINATCQQVDCSPLLEGGSCNFLTVSERASYAFNSNYQLNDQATSSCDPEFGRVVRDDPSHGNCRFMRQIVVNSAERERLFLLHKLYIY